MPTGRIRPEGATAQLRNTDVPTGRGGAITITGRSIAETPTARTSYSAILSPGVSSVIPIGTPIGLLLSLTYATDIDISTSTVFKGEVPTGKIRNT